MMRFVGDPGRTPGACRRPLLLLALATAAVLGGCTAYVRQADLDVARLISERQRTALNRPGGAQVCSPDELPDPGRSAYDQRPPTHAGPVPPDFEPGPPPAEDAADGAPPAVDTLAPLAPRVGPLTRGARLFTLTDALRYALQYRREYQTAKEDLYLVALALTLERHLWTPIFASNLRTVYGNFGEATDFDQAMRFVADLAVSQRLPYGGSFTASAISTLIRDVKRSITAAEGSVVQLGLDIPLLRGAGHVAQEQLIQLERELTYAVRAFERFRRQQLVTVANGYFDLLQAKEDVFDAERSYASFVKDFERAQAVETAGLQELPGQSLFLDTQRAAQAMFQAQNRVELAREAFRSEADRFKLLIGMPVDEPLDRDDLEDIDTMERQIAAGVYPVLLPPPAVGNEERSLTVALERRFDLQTAADRIDDARRGVAISKNALLPDLNWTGTLSVDTDPLRYNIAQLDFQRANWRTELLLSLPLERTAERNALRRALIDVRQAERTQIEVAENIRAEVRRAVNQLVLADRSVEIQRNNVAVAEQRQEYAQILFENGDITNRDKVEAEDDLLQARTALSAAKTGRWSALLQFRLSTETLVIEDDGSQSPDIELLCDVPLIRTADPAAAPVPGSEAAPPPPDDTPVAPAGEAPVSRPAAPEGTGSPV